MTVAMLLLVLKGPSKHVNVFTSVQNTLLRPLHTSKIVHQHFFQSQNLP